MPHSLSVSLIVLTLLLATFVLSGTAGADGGVPIPAPAGTVWSIVAGYNTETHSDADNGDPHAIDIVRIPREETSGTAVLSPVDGTVRWLDWDCLMITDAAGYEHLLCHVSPLGHLQRGSAVAIGEQVAVVCREFECNNNGLAHIHYAVHESRGGGYLGRSIPFTERYALEGQQLPWHDKYNLHAGLEFTSTNGPGWTPPTDVDQIADDPVSDPEDRETTVEDTVDSAPTWIVPDDAPVGGWRTVSVYERTSVAGLFANLDSPLLELVVHNPFLDTFHRFDPDDEASAQIAVQSLQPGQAIWALVEPQARWLPAPPTGPRSMTIQLAAGVNMVSWQGPDRAVAEALRNVAHFERAYRYDAYTDSWTLYVPGAPDFVNTLDTLRSGDAFHLVVRAGSTWTQLP